MSDVGETPEWAQPSAPPPSSGWQNAPGWQQQPPPAPGWDGAPGWQGYAPRADYKPGVVALRPLSVGEILDGGFATIRRNPRIVFGSAFVLAAALELVRLGLGAALSNVGGAVTSSLPRQDGSRLVITSGGVAAVVVSYVASAIFSALLAGVVTEVVGKAVVGQRVNGRTVLNSVGSRWWRLALVSVLAGALPFLPVLFLLAGPVGIIPAIPLALYLWGKLTVAVPAFVLERTGVGAAISRSWRLVRGAFWRTWGLRALAYLIVVIAGGVLSIPFGISTFNDLNGGSSPSAGSIALSTVGGGIVWMLTEPLLAAAVTLIYIDRRMRAEGLDIQLAQAARQAADAPRAT